MHEDVFSKVEDFAEDMKDTLMNMLKISAIGPDNGGDGEMERAEFLMNILLNFGFDRIERYDAPDARVSAGVRPNIIAIKDGREDKNVVLLSHMDIVPEGDLDEWDTDPYDPVFKDGKIYGRGAEDNGQEVIASIYAAKVLDELDIVPKYNLMVALVSDEETGSEYGVKYLVDQGLFSEDDLIIVPDHSEELGKKIEVKEKSAMWVKITVHGKQGHAAIPGPTINANRVACRYQTVVDERLQETFDDEDPLFSPARSTLEPTKREANVPNINTIPGKDVQYYDCRIIPDIKLESVKKVFTDTAEEISRETGTEIDIDIIKGKKAPEGTSTDSEVFIKLKRAVEKVTGHTPEPAGIGGGTVAAHFREKGIPAVVWCTNEELAHQPNEYAVLDYIVKDCKVFTTMLLED
ncbi:MAG: M20 family metallo-hydrolase [Thermoplasmata archaeon]